MRKYQRFEELPVWQEAARLYNRVLDIVEDGNPLLSSTFRNRLERAALCVANNVAEGFEGTKLNDLIGLLASARGAAAEVQSMVALVEARPTLARLRQPLQEIHVSAESCVRQLGAWRAVVEKPAENKRPPVEQPLAAPGGGAVNQGAAPPRRTPVQAASGSAR